MALIVFGRVRAKGASFTAGRPPCSPAASRHPSPGLAVVPFQQSDNSELMRLSGNRLVGHRTWLLSGLNGLSIGQKAYFSRSLLYSNTARYHHRNTTRCSRALRIR